MKAGRAHQVSLVFREPALGESGMRTHQAFAYDKAQNGIAQKFELLVVLDRRTVRRPLIHVRFVGERALQQLTILKYVSELFFESPQIELHDIDKPLPPQTSRRRKCMRPTTGRRVFSCERGASHPENALLAAL